MTPSLLTRSFSALTAAALLGSLAVAQTPATTPPDGSQPPAPVERHSPAPPPPYGMHPPMMPGGPMHRFGEHRDRSEGMEGGFHIGPGGMWWKNPRIADRLSLTPDQVKRMDGIFQESRLKLIDLHANVQKQEVMLDPLLSANPLDTARAQAQIDKVADARAELEKANAHMLLGIRAVLTPDQWTKLHERPTRSDGKGMSGPHDGMSGPHGPMGPMGSPSTPGQAGPPPAQ